MSTKPDDGLDVVAARLNDAVAHAQEGDLMGALVRYEHAFDALPDGRTLQVPEGLRLELVGRRLDLLARLRDEYKLRDLLAAEAPETRVQLITQLLERVRDRDAPDELLSIAREIVAWGQESGDSLSVMAASWFVPYAYRGLGEHEQAREHASVILARAREVGHAEYITEWETFLASLDRG
jgi:hypothetical protein